MIPVRVFPLYSNCLINNVAFSLVIVLSLLTSHDPLSMGRYGSGQLLSGSRRVAGSIPPWACRSVLEQDT